MNPNLRHVTGMFGLGDNIYQRAVVREMGPVHLVTAWPQLYRDLPNVECLPASTVLRTQHKNVLRGWPWAHVQRRYAGRLRIGYDGQAGTILDRFLHSARLQPGRHITFDLPDLAGPFRIAPVDRPYVLVRPATVRQEWPAASRNPNPIYITHAARAAQMAGYAVILVADLQEGEEEAVGLLPPADIVAIRGEFELPALMGLVQHAAGVIGGVGWLLPAALAYRTPMLCIWGGWGHTNGPQRVLDPRISTEHLVQAIPDNLCMCNDRDHKCDKTISNFRSHIDEFLGLASAAATRLAA
jgi:hypothetical protein